MTWKGLCFIFSKIWGKTKKGAFPATMTFVGLLMIAIGLCAFWFVSFKLESDKERANGVLGMSRLDWQFVSQAARKGDYGRVWYERAWLGDKLEIQHSEMQRHAHPDSTLVWIYTPDSVENGVHYEVFPNGEAKEWKMPPTPPIFPKK